ncbi:glycosyl hydrolase [Pelagicoccus sp. SDUM812005]|uniref:glycosyl hydrolase n=1 Tax=Pelagicoccus sp. SDUM812005 TaxID=3041257 RepID=UPI00280F9E27|nr:glycosyl hydrolase [Pelagicoccus sp. SDUM812005]MDQ8179136.1 glycosyl hydrolase [Pelagicoccus sp. SDUM812005]
MRALGTRIAFAAFAVSAWCGPALAAAESDWERAFDRPPESAKPWTIWYWLKGAVSKEGIAADLEAMKEVGLAGAYLMPLISPDEEPFWEPPVETLSDEYWELVGHAMEEARERGLKLGLHVGPGFSLAGGPWITPELSMQRVVWSEVSVEGGRRVEISLDQPPTGQGYYRDIALFAVREREDFEKKADSLAPRVTTNAGESVSRLALAENGEPLRMSEAGWIEYAYPELVTVRSVKIRPHGNSYQALRLRLEASVDGENFDLVKQFVPPRHGWQDGGQSVGQSLSFSVPETRAKVFRFVFDPEGSEPGAEDLDWAKWKPILKVKRIQLSSMPRLEQFEGKSAAVWRVAEWTDEEQVPAGLAVAREDVIDLSSRMEADGSLRWDAPEGKWTLLRMGHTSTGATNYTGGAGEGLEADKLNPEAIKLQFDSWFAETSRRVGPELFSEVVRVLHSDSWEAESQNWTQGLAEEFRARRGYDPIAMLPAMAGVVVESAERSERFLYDLRLTISELLNDSYFETLSELARQYNCEFSSESVSPTMVSDNLRHHGTVDLPMGEFWLKSPTHDKPMDMRDAVSGAHIYGKRIVQAEAFTQLRIAWDEAPHNLKALGDRHFALGVNRFVFHVFMQTPWVDKVPGVSLNGVGLFFQRGQTWWNQGKAWVEYLSRCQALLQLGEPVVDIAVFAGEERPARALLPDRVLGVLPGLAGEARLHEEFERLANAGNKLREEPKGVKASAGISDLSDWCDPLSGYTYESLNLDVLLDGASVHEGRLRLKSGAEYGVLVVPGKHRLNPEGGVRMSSALASALVSFAKEGLPIILESEPRLPLSLLDGEDALRALARDLADQPSVHLGPWSESDLDALGISQDIRIIGTRGTLAGEVAWTHRRSPEGELYFVSNQSGKLRDLRLSFRVAGLRPEVWDPVTGERRFADSWKSEASRTELGIRLHANQSLFFVFKEEGTRGGSRDSLNTAESVPHQRLDGPWTVQFPERTEPVEYKRYLDSWTLHEDAEVKHFSGTATYSRTFDYEPSVAQGRVWLDLGMVADVAEVILNGESLGVLWTAPWQVEVTGHLRSGENQIRIEVTNTWKNQLIADEARRPQEKQLWTNAPFRLKDEPLREAGLLGPVLIRCEVPGRSPARVVIPFPEALKSDSQPVPAAVMQEIYEEAKTPFKYGVVLAGGEGELLDCPNVFRHGDKWYMMFVGITDGVGYQTYLAESDDLLHWKRLGTILPFAESGWDKWQGDGGLSLIDHEWGGSAALQQYDGKYWMSYIGGSMKGYETDPLSAGLAWTSDPHKVEAWTRYEGNPILSPNHEYARPFERKTVYKSHIVWDKAEQLGWPFVMYYNGKEERGGGHEAIGMAVSRDMKAWHRYGEKNVVYNKGELPWAITGDPQIVKMGDVWVMFYFGAFWKPGAFDTFAASYDLVNWTKWEGPHLVEPSEPFDKQFAHKPWLLKHDGVVYHFYCAVGEEGRVIALATSEDLK